MKMRDSLMSIGNLLMNDETLLRLLYYKSANYNDSPLDPSKANLVGNYSVVESLIFPTQKVADLVGNTDEICRLCFYHGNRFPERNYLVADQEMWFEVYTHVSFDQVDYRLSWICDRVAELVFNQRSNGTFGKILFKNGMKIAAPLGYMGYRLAYVYGNMN